MTTIVADKKNLTMYCDTQCNSNNKFNIQKIFLIDNCLYGFAGNVYNANLFLKYIKQINDCFNNNKIFNSKELFNNINLDLDDEDFEIIEITENKQMFLISKNGSKFEILDDFYSIGSGANCALAVLHYQKEKNIKIDVMEAFSITTKIDYNTNNNIIKMKINKKK